ncbi:MAG: right-handed parallel beta-helix repeat-containing protein, partial [Bacteroidota bacterium]
MKKVMAVLMVGWWMASAQDNFVRGIWLHDSTNVNFSLMHDSLHLNWVEAIAENGDGTKRLNVLENSGSLYVIGNMGQYLTPKSFAQHMVFEAEQNENNPDQNYFGFRNGVVQNDTLLQSPSSAGYMVTSPTPNNEYYNETHYTARFVLKRTPAQGGNPEVVRLEVEYSGQTWQSILRDSDFTSSNFETKSLEFDLPSSAVSAMAPGGLLTGSFDGAAPSKMTMTSGGVDIRVYWSGNVTTWLDKVIVDDNPGHNLFSGVYDDVLRSSASDFHDNYPLVRRFYLQDEPHINQFLVFKYVNGKIREATGEATGIAASNAYRKRFLDEAQPNELMVNCYPIRGYIPTPAMTDAEAQSVGIMPFDNNPGWYTQHFQYAMDTLVMVLSDAATLTKNHGKSFWNIPQLHGVYFDTTGKFQKQNGEVMQRPPTGNEIKVMCNLAIAYGAKGVVPFMYPTYKAIWDGYARFDGLVSVNDNHSSNYATYDSPSGPKNVRVGYAEKWNSLAEVMGKCAQLSTTLSSMQWQGSKSWNNDSTAGTWSGFISSVVAKTTAGAQDNATYVETGHFTLGNDTYLFVVNRRTLDSTDVRDISITMSGSSNWCVQEMISGEMWIARGGYPFTDCFQPGEGKLYKCSSLSSWSGTVSIPSNVTITAGATLTISPGTTLSMQTGKEIIVYGTLNLGTGSSGTITLGGNEVFRAKSGGTIIVAESTTLNNLRNMTIETDGVLTVNNAAVLKFNSATDVYDESPPKGSLGVSGRFNAYGATFTSNSTNPDYYWAGIYVVNSNPQDDNNSVQHCTISQCKFGLSINNSQFSGFGNEIAWNKFTKCLNPIGLTYGAVVQEIVGDTLEDNLEDGIVVWQSAVGRAYGNVIRKVNTSQSGRDGFWIYGANSQALITDNQISYGSQDGIRCEYYAAPNLGGPNGYATAPGNNSITANSRHGVHAQSTTNPFLGDYDYANDCAKYGGFNYIYSNGNKQLNAVPYNIRAEWNWWGTDPDDPYDPWNFDYYNTYISLFGGLPFVRPAMRFDGGEDLMALVKDRLTLAVDAAEEESVSEEKVLLVLADQLTMSRMYEAALAVYDSLIVHYPTSDEAEAALLRIHYAMLSFNKILMKEGKATKDGLQYFADIYSRSIGTRLEKSSAELAAINAELQRDDRAAIDYNNLIMNQWPGTESEKHALATLYGVYQRVGDAANASVA